MSHLCEGCDRLVNSSHSCSLQAFKNAFLETETASIFAYLNFCTPKKRDEIIEILLQGLRRMECRGCDSAGIAIDSCNGIEARQEEISILRKFGKVDVLEAYIRERGDLDLQKLYMYHCGIGQTLEHYGARDDRDLNPQNSNNNVFVVVHTGIIKNLSYIKKNLEKQNVHFHSNRDTEVIAKLIHHIHERYPNFGFRQLVETTIQQLDGDFALAFKSRLFSNQLVASRRGSPLLVGIKSASRILTDDRLTVNFSTEQIFDIEEDKGNIKVDSSAKKCYSLGTEYFFASDASAIIEHTKQVLYLEDDDVAVVESKHLSIHRIERHDDPSNETREVVTAK
uniref:Glutamine amidotransferase type-2 domain-containing protein n=1 Tax=Panagrolaimus sp. ES5 TaxID=591445 RepID=A0AC34G613_9BILA